MKLRTICAWLVSAILTVSGCSGSSGPSGTTRFDPPNVSFAERLGISPPVTQDQAMAIAAEAAGGTAISAGQETENGELLFEVKVDTPSGRKEVEVRASTGGVVEIEPDDSD